ncbi:allatostatins MIP [Culicoides brevitarsis]|uniref:allatostatins MIP n=1 Tax=Culicoides brevitarsis TaxID=469753 RepID=UPI00307C48C3
MFTTRTMLSLASTLVFLIAATSCTAEQSSAVLQPPAPQNPDNEKFYKLNEKRSWQNLQSKSWGKRRASSGSFEDLLAARLLSLNNPSVSREIAGYNDDMMIDELMDASRYDPLEGIYSSDEESFYRPSAEKRAWKNMNNAWGKRVERDWNKFRGSWGKREPGWNNLKGLWGKRASDNWNKLQSGWGKRDLGLDSNY